MEQAETCCFTGHRPDKLPWGVREDDPRCTDLKARLAAALEAEYDAGTRHFICGMARGADLYFAEAVLALRERRSGVTLEAAGHRRSSGGIRAFWSGAIMRPWSSTSTTAGA